MTRQENRRSDTRDGPVWLSREKPEWHLRAPCRGMPTSVWYPDRGPSRALMKALREMCRACPVRPECITQGIEERHGWFGGMSERDRARLRKHGEVELRCGDVILWDRETDDLLVVPDTEPEDLVHARLRVISEIQRRDDPVAV